MRQFMIFAIGAVVGVAIGITIGEMFALSRIPAKVLGISCAMLGGYTTVGLAMMRGWITSSEVR